MRDKIKKKLKRFDYYRFMIDRNIFTSFVMWCEFHHLDRNSYRVRHNFIVHKGLMSELVGHPCYDRKNVINPGEFVDRDEMCRIAKTKWLSEV